ncbi:hypothetical protein C8J57DRAFT_1719529 [Mycena rebaudengoi]|nr:hypothetical protein C8J57DRAFT_1719529 [Mycena rebaudengoi]
MSDQAEIAFLRGSQPVTYADSLRRIPVLQILIPPLPLSCARPRRPTDSIARIKEQLAHAYPAAPPCYLDDGSICGLVRCDSYGFASDEGEEGGSVSVLDTSRALCRFSQLRRDEMLTCALGVAVPQPTPTVLLRELDTADAPPSPSSPLPRQMTPTPHPPYEEPRLNGTVACRHCHPAPTALSHELGTARTPSSSCSSASSPFQDSVHAPAPSVVSRQTRYTHGMCMLGVAIAATTRHHVHCRRLSGDAVRAPDVRARRAAEELLEPEKDDISDIGNYCTHRRRTSLLPLPNDTLSPPREDPARAPAFSVAPSVVPTRDACIRRAHALLPRFPSAAARRPRIGCTRLVCLRRRPALRDPEGEAAHAYYPLSRQVDSARRLAARIPTHARDVIFRSTQAPRSDRRLPAAHGAASGVQNDNIDVDMDRSR